jgi:hypothetical protein
MLFFVKVRIDVTQMAEMGRRLADGTLDRSALRSTYCHAFDPEVGLNIWEAETPEEFRRLFAPHRAYYRDVIEVTPVVTPPEAMAMLQA